MVHFQDYTKCPIDIDNMLLRELHYAGISSVWETSRANETECSKLKAFVSSKIAVVKTSTYGELYGWAFTRHPKYWEAKGPGIDVEHAELLHQRYGSEVRVGGSVNAPSPMQHYKGLASGYYHVDTFEGLRALASTIKLIVEGPKPLKILGINIPIPGEMHMWLAML